MTTTDVETAGPLDLDSPRVGDSIDIDELRGADCGRGPRIVSHSARARARRCRARVPRSALPLSAARRSRASRPAPPGSARDPPPASPRFDGDEEARSSPPPSSRTSPPRGSRRGKSSASTRPFRASTRRSRRSARRTARARRSTTPTSIPATATPTLTCADSATRSTRSSRRILPNHHLEPPPVSAGRGPFPSAPEAPASVAFVNPFRCLGRRCPPTQCCVTRSPTSFGWREDTGAAGWRRGDARDWSALRGRARTTRRSTNRARTRGAWRTTSTSPSDSARVSIRWVTPMQADALEAAVERAAEAATEAEPDARGGRDGRDARQGGVRERESRRGGHPGGSRNERASGWIGTRREEMGKGREGERRSGERRRGGTFSD